LRFRDIAGAAEIFKKPPSLDAGAMAHIRNGILISGKYPNGAAAGRAGIPFGERDNLNG